MAEDIQENPGQGSGSPEPAGNIALTRAVCTFCRGVLHAIGMFDPAVMTEEEKAEDPAEYRTWFCLGETCMAALLALNIAVPAFFWMLRVIGPETGENAAAFCDSAGIAPLPLAVTGAAVVFLPLFVFLPKLIRSAMKADTDAVLEAFGKNEQVRKVFWSVFIALAGLVLAQVVDPATVHAILAALTGA